MLELAYLLIKQLMSKNNPKNSQVSSVDAGIHAAEYRIIKHDLIRVVILNLVYLAAVLALYYTNLKSGYLETLFTKIFHF